MLQELIRFKVEQGEACPSERAMLKKRNKENSRKSRFIKGNLMIDMQVNTYHQGMYFQFSE